MELDVEESLIRPKSLGEPMELDVEEKQLPPTNFYDLKGVSYFWYTTLTPSILPYLSSARTLPTLYTSHIPSTPPIRMRGVEGRSWA